ncbi:type VI secretion system baseplate subunit TssK [Lampropedia aestuarii]|uniref:Type VI secretion system baseplate subunit TssK n=1 Tax=Lampropedia aestuarii TaxID=2562762 RepID=A0A4S5BFQ3_9BURK|nr:type VI secretion system baseplate subunit TssK [Lampropedia aestuarii]THJ31070.1 type VI secretion system baseplate subunit TssK [Lampropedia aestuarii]
MGYENKVIWSEGMFLRSQHFQQQERYVESRLFQSITALVGFHWGFSVLEVDEEALRLGTVLLRRAQGILPDGTPFKVPGDDGKLQVAFDVPMHLRDAKLCLVLPPMRTGAESVIFTEDSTSGARYIADSIELRDGNEAGAGLSEIQVGLPRFRLMPEAEVPHGWMAMGVVRVVERQTNNVCRLDDEYVPPFLRCMGQEVLAGYLREAIGLLHQRGEVLAQRLSAAGRGLSEVGEFLLLKVVNHWQPLLQHLERVEVLHPERLYSELLALVGELAAFTATSRRPVNFPAYRHDDLENSFRPLIIELRQALSVVLDQKVVRIELQDRKYGVKTALIPDKTLLKNASFVLAAHANLPAEQVHTRFPTQVKIGPVEKIRDLVNLHLPGVVLKPLPVAPRELPYNAGYNYFELDTQHVLWRELDKSAGMALHIAGEFPGLELECWAIRK